MDFTKMNERELKTLSAWVNQELTILQDVGFSENVVNIVNDRFEELKDASYTIEESKQADAIIERILNHLPLSPITDGDIWVEKEHLELGKYLVAERYESLIKLPQENGRVSYADMNRILTIDVHTTEPVEDANFATAVGMVVDNLAPITLPYMPQQIIACVELVEDENTSYVFDILEMVIDGKSNFASNGRYKTDVVNNKLEMYNHTMVCDDSTQWVPIEQPADGIFIKAYHRYPALRVFEFDEEDGSKRFEYVDLNRVAIQIPDADDNTDNTDIPDTDTLHSVVSDIVHHYYHIYGLPYTPSCFKVKIDIKNKYEFSIIKARRADDPTCDCDLLIGTYKIEIEDEVPTWSKTSGQGV